MAISGLVLIALVIAVALLLPIGLAIVAIAFSAREDRRTVIAVVAAGGLLSLLCICTAAGVIWFLSTR